MAKKKDGPESGGGAGNGRKSTPRGRTEGPASPAGAASGRPGARLSAEAAARRAVEKLKSQLQAGSLSVEVGAPGAAAPPVAMPRDEGGAFRPASFQFRVGPHDLAGGVEQLRQHGRHGSWLAFLFDTTRVSEDTDDRSLALQYSVEHGRVGLDWVLLGPRNVADAEAVVAFMQASWHTVRHRLENRVDYLRVEDGDLARLGERILGELYGVPASAELGLLVDGLWLSPGRRTPP
jgi:hypothetical protein